MPAPRRRVRRLARPIAAIRPVPADAAAFEPTDWSDPSVLGDWAVPGGPRRANGGAGASSGEDASEESEPRRNHMTGGRARNSSVPPGPEEKICVVHPAMFRAHPGRYLLLVLLFIGGIAGLITGFVKEPYAWLRFVGGPALLAAVIWWFWWWFFSTVCVKLEITNKRSIRQEGFVRRSSTEVLHDHVRSVDITQSVMQRMLNVGYIGIDSAGQDGIEIEIGDIPRPYDVKAIIDRYRRM